MWQRCSWVLLAGAAGTLLAGCSDGKKKFLYAEVGWAVRCPRGTAGCAGVDSYRIQGFEDELPGDQRVSCELRRAGSGYVFELQASVGGDWLQLQDVRFGEDMSVSRCTVRVRQGGANDYVAEPGACGSAPPQPSTMGCEDASGARCQVAGLEIYEDEMRGVRGIRGTLLCYCIEAPSIANTAFRFRDVTGPAGPAQPASFLLEEGCDGDVF